MFTNNHNRSICFRGFSIEPFFESFRIHIFCWFNSFFKFFCASKVFSWCGLRELNTCFNMEIYLTIFYIFNLGGGGSRKYYPPRCWFFFNNSNGKSCSPGILEHSVTIHRDICAEFGIPNSPQSPDIGQNSDGGISDFWISGQFFIKENCQLQNQWWYSHETWTSN